MKEEKYAELEKKVFKAYEKKTPKSRQMYGQACQSLQGGVPGDGGYWRPYPLYVTHGKGSKIYDLDGNEYIDCRCGYGAILLGHAHAEVNESIGQEMSRGLLLHNLILGVEAAELLTKLIPCAEAVRYRNTGTEVLMAALAVARAYTGKNKFIKFYGAYHGVAPEFMAGWGSRTTDSTSSGIPRESLANTVILPWNDINAVRQKLDEDKDIGTVVTDVIMGVGGIFPPKGDYLKELRQLTDERGVVLIFDEVITGFRLAIGGAQDYFGVIPDLACFAKSISAGATFAALVGKKNIMSALGGGSSGAFMFGGGRKVVYQSGTFNDNTLGTAGAIVSMKIFEKLNKRGEYEKLNSRTEKYAREIEESFRKRGIGCYVNTAGSYYKIHLTDVKPTFDIVCGIDKRVNYLFTVALMTEGVLLCGPGSGSSFLSFAHIDEDVVKILDAMNSTLDKFNWVRLFCNGFEKQ